MSQSESPSSPSGTAVPGAEAPERSEVATFGAGCFWKPEAIFREVPGVVDTAVGYEGGQVVTFDQLLEVFWAMHDPTQVNRQGPDVGDQYRTVIFTHTPEQVAAAEASRAAQQEHFRDPVATSIEPATGFWMAEEYHQCYLEQRRSGGLLGTLLGR